jgi:hypothetical protein
MAKLFGILEELVQHFADEIEWHGLTA